MAISSGIISMYIDHTTPLLAIGSSLSAIGGSPIYSLNIDISVIKYLDFKIILKGGQSLATQVPIIFCQVFSVS